MGQALRNSLTTSDEDTLYRVLEAIPEAVVVTDDEGRYVFANAAARELTGRTLAQLRKLTVAGISAPEQPVEAVWNEITHVGTLQGDFELVRPDGTTFTVEFNARTNVVPGRHVGFLRDVTQQRRLDRRLRREEAKFVQAFVQAPVAMTIRLLSTGVFVEANEAFLELTGRWRAEVIGRTGDDMGLWEDAQPATDVLAQLRHGIPSSEAVATLITRKGESRKVALSARRVEINAEPHSVSVYVPL